jgi:hypothetical protein
VPVLNKEFSSLVEIEFQGLVARGDDVVVKLITEAEVKFGLILT